MLVMLSKADAKRILTERYKQVEIELDHVREEIGCLRNVLELIIELKNANPWFWLLQSQVDGARHRLKNIEFKLSKINDNLVLVGLSSDFVLVGEDWVGWDEK